jgi:CRP-like cAMP-binding protein
MGFVLNGGWEGRSMVNLDTLEKVEIFKDLDDRRLSAVSECCTEVVLQRGQDIFKAGEEARQLWAVAEGRVMLEAEQASTLQGNEVAETQVFGWPSLVRPHIYRFSASCAARSARLIRIDSGCLQALFGKDPELGYKVMSGLLRVIGDRFHQVQEEVVKRKGQEMMNQW